MFPDATGPLSEVSRKKIYQQYRRGVSVDVLAKRFCRTRTTIYRVINEMRAERIMELPLDYIPHASFNRADADARFCSRRSRLRRR